MDTKQKNSTWKPLGGKVVNQKATETEEGHLVATQPLQQQLAIAKKG